MVNRSTTWSLLIIECPVNNIPFWFSYSLIPTRPIGKWFMWSIIKIINDFFSSPAFRLGVAHNIALGIFDCIWANRGLKLPSIGIFHRMTWKIGVLVSIYIGNHLTETDRVLLESSLIRLWLSNSFRIFMNLWSFLVPIFTLLMPVMVLNISCLMIVLNYISLRVGLFWNSFITFINEALP